MAGIGGDFLKKASRLELIALNLWSEHTITPRSYLRHEVFYLTMETLPSGGYSSEWLLHRYGSFATKIWIIVGKNGTQVGTMQAPYLIDSCCEYSKQHCKLLAAVSYQEEITGFIEGWSQLHP